MMMETQNILPCRLKRKKWEAPRRYILTISLKKRIRDREHTLQCRIPLTIIMTQFYTKSAVFRLFMRRPIFDGSRQYDKLQWVYAKLMSVSREVHIRTRCSGVVWEILNQQEIKDQWPGVKQQIAQMYEDSLVERILARQQHNLTHHFEQTYRREPMMQLLFNNLFGDYQKDAPTQTNKVWPQHLADLPFPMVERKQLTKRSRRQATIAVEGRPLVEQIDWEAAGDYFGKLLGNPPAAPYHCSYDGEYLIDTARGSIREAILQMEGILGEVYDKKMTYHLTTTDDE